MQPSSSTLEAALRKALRGSVIGPRDPSYEAARKVWNARIDKRPAVVVRCVDEADVVAAVNIASESGVLTAIRGGGHSVAGHGTCEGGLVIDLSGMDSVAVDPERRLASVGGGAIWRGVDENTHGHGLATVGGQISSTGVGGLTLGGGRGWLMRRYGLTVDNLLSARVVLADGSIVECNRDSESDLFWAIRGGGGNFGVVTEFELGLHHVRNVTAGVLLYPAERAAAMIKALTEYAPEQPRDLMVIVIILAGSMQPFVPDDLKGLPIAGFGICHVGTPEEAERDLKPLTAVGRPALDTVGVRPYPALQQMFDSGSRAGLNNYWRAPFLAEVPITAIETITEHAALMTSPISQVLLTHMEGAVSDVDEAATPVHFRRAPYYLECLAKWAGHEDDEGQHLEWADAFARAVEPYATRGSYLNFLGDASFEDIAAAYGDANLDRLRAVKRAYDRHNLFRVNHNVEPAVG